MKYLLENERAKATCTNEYGQTILHIAAESCCVGIIKLFIHFSGSFINQQDSEGNTALHKALSHPHGTDAAKLLVNTGRCDLTITNNKGETAIETGRNINNYNISQYISELETALGPNRDKTENEDINSQHITLLLSD